MGFFPTLPELVRSSFKPVLNSFEGEVMNEVVEILYQLGQLFESVGVTKSDLESSIKCTSRDMI